MDIVIGIISVCVFCLELVYEFLDHFHPEGQISFVREAYDRFAREAYNERYKLIETHIRQNKELAAQPNPEELLVRHRDEIETLMAKNDKADTGDKSQLTEFHLQQGYEHYKQAENLEEVLQYTRDHITNTAYNSPNKELKQIDDFAREAYDRFAREAYNERYKLIETHIGQNKELAAQPNSEKLLVRHRDEIKILMAELEEQRYDFLSDYNNSMIALRARDANENQVL